MVKRKKQLLKCSNCGYRKGYPVQDGYGVKCAKCGNVDYISRIRI